MKSFLTMLNEASEDSVLSDILGQIWENYVEETGDEEGENYDLGLGILTTYADKIPDDVAADIAADLADIFGLIEDEDEDLEEGLKIVKKKKKTASEKQKAHKEYMKNRSKLKLAVKKWRKSAAGKKWLEKYEKFKSTHKNLKGKRITTK